MLRGQGLETWLVFSTEISQYKRSIDNISGLILFNLFRLVVSSKLILGMIKILK